MIKKFILFSVTTLVFVNLLVFNSKASVAETYEDSHCPFITEVQTKYYKSGKLVIIDNNSSIPIFSQGSIDTIVFDVKAFDPQSLPMSFYTASYLITGKTFGEDKTNWTNDNSISLNVEEALRGNAWVQVRIDNNDGFYCMGDSPAFNFDAFQNFYYDVTASSIACTSFAYSDWSSCLSDGQQTRSIVASLPSDCSEGNPILTQACAYTLPTCTSWTYTNWSSCVNGQQIRTIESSQPINCSGGSPVLSQSCNSEPLCTESNWTSILTPTSCLSDGQQTKKWIKTEECEGGVFHPAEENVSCNYQVQTCTNFSYSNWSECDSHGVQSRKIVYSSPSGCIGGNPTLRQICKIKDEDIINNQITANKNTVNNTISKTELIAKDIIEKEKQLIVTIDNNLSKRMKGNILLQVEKNGEGWYVNPDNEKKYYLGRPADAFNIMRNLGLGIKHSELQGYINSKFPTRLAGKILLDVEENGEAYYINPNNLRGYFLNRPADAFKVMRELGLGITNSDIRKIDIGEID